MSRYNSPALKIAFFTVLGACCDFCQSYPINNEKIPTDIIIAKEGISPEIKAKANSTIINITKETNSAFPIDKKNLGNIDEIIVIAMTIISVRTTAIRISSIL